MDINSPNKIFSSLSLDFNDFPNELTDNLTDNFWMGLLINIIIIVVGLGIGLGIGYLLFSDIKYVGPDSNKIVKKTWTDEKGKYKFVPKITICPMNYSMGKLHDQKFKSKH
jgi:hypothetical protein